METIRQVISIGIAELRNNVIGNMINSLSFPMLAIRAEEKNIRIIEESTLSPMGNTDKGICVESLILISKIRNSNIGNDTEYSHIGGDKYLM
jgi:hypothetical protein